MTTVHHTLRAEITESFKQRRGPFRHLTVAAHEVVGYYGLNRIRKGQANTILRELSPREVKLTRRDGPILIVFMVGDDAGDLKPELLHLEYLKSRGL